MSDPPEELPDEAKRHWLAPLVFVAVVAAVAGGALSVGARYRGLHGADFFTGIYLDARLRPPPSVAGGTRGAHTIAWPLAQGSGSLRVRFETLSRGRARAVTVARVEPGADVADGVEASVRVTGYDATTTGADGTEAPIGHVALECVETAADGVHTHRLELRGDGTSYDPDAIR